MSADSANNGLERLRTTFEGASSVDTLAFSTKTPSGVIRGVDTATTSGCQDAAQ